MTNKEIIKEFKKKTDFIETLLVMANSSRGYSHDKAVKLGKGNYKFILACFKEALSSQRKEIIEKIIKEKPFVDLTRDLKERDKANGYLDEWEKRINLIRDDNS